MQIHRNRTGAATICVLAVLLTFGTACKKKSVAPTAELRDPEYDVLSSWITDKFADRKNKELLEPVGNGLAKIVIFNLTESDELHRSLDANGKQIPWTETAKSLIKEAPTLQSTTIDAFRQVNTQQASLRRSFHPALDYELVDASRIDSIFQKNGGDWSAYYKQYPGSPGILALSRVGFSSDGRQALFYVSNRCGGLCGGGGYVVMENIGGHWVIQKEIEKWVS
jgi:hypothetical protein